MDFKVTSRDCTAKKRVEMTELRKGEWTVEEDSKLIDCVSIHGPAQWSYLAHSAGLKRTGKSCRLRWLNYLRPGVKHGNFTLEEQILILELHSRWGNRWSRIAQGLPGRTDNEIKNYWRTRVQKLANQLNCDVNSTQFRDTLHHIWLPRLREQAQATAASSAQSTMVLQPINTTPTDHIAWNNTITGYELSDSYCTKYSESPPEVANQVSPASDLSAYGDHQGDVLVSSGNWWERIQEKGAITHTDQVGVSGYYSEQEEGYWCHVFEECNRWFGGGGGDSFDHLNDDVNWLIMT